jgi:nucleotide-binding universal stress UspA family protein
MTQFDRILCPVDLSDGSQRALQAAAALARWYEATLTVLHVYASWPMTEMIPALHPPEARPQSLVDEDRVRMRTTLVRFTEAAIGTSHETTVRYELADTPEVVPEILRHAGDSDLVVMGTHGRSGLPRLMLGSAAERVLRKAPCPVLVVPPHAVLRDSGTPPWHRVVCGIDFSDASLAALEYAISLAEESDATLTLLHAIEIPPELSQTPGMSEVDVDRVRAGAEAEALRRLRGLIPESARESCTVRTSVAEGRAAREIVRLAESEKEDLIVLGVRGRNAVDLVMFGSNTQYVVRAAPCPVLVVHGTSHPMSAQPPHEHAAHVKSA